MLKFGLFAALLVSASAAAAQPPAGQAVPAQPPAAATAPQQQGPIPPPAFIEAAQGFGLCMQTQLGGLPATVTPEAGAAQALAACATQKTALETQFQSWVASPAFPAEQRDAVLAQFRAEGGQLETQIAGMIRQRRTGAAQPPAQAPAQPQN